MITVRINLLIALVTVIILISSFEIQRGVHAIEQVISLSVPVFYPTIEIVTSQQTSPSNPRFASATQQKSNSSKHKNVSNCLLKSS